MQEEHYQYLRELMKLKDYAINMTHHIDSLYENFLRMPDEDKDVIIENAHKVSEKQSESFRDYAAEDKDIIIENAHKVSEKQSEPFRDYAAEFRFNCMMDRKHTELCRQVDERLRLDVKLPFLWKAVRLIDWPTQCRRYRKGENEDDDYDAYYNRPYNVGRQILLDIGWSNDALKIAQTELRILSGRLKEMWKEMGKSLDIGDDSWSDLINHVIGCGPKCILDIMDNPKLLRRYNKEKEESFSYCFCV